METAPAASQPPAPQHAGSGFATLTRGQLVFTIAGMLLTLLLAAMDQTIVGIAMPRVVESLNGFDRYPWVTTSYLLTSTIAVPVFAKLSDLYGRKWFYLAGAVIFVLSSCLCGAAGNVPLPLDGMNQLIFFRGLQGIGGGAIIGLSFTIIGDLFSPAERGRYQGLFGAVFGVASVVGPILGGWITDNFSWRWIFYVNAPIGVLAVAVLYYKFPHFRPHLKKRVIDWAGVAALCAWLTPLLLALSEVGLGGWGSPRVQGMLAFSAVVFALFLWIETRAVEPLLPLSLFKNSSMALTSAGIFLLGVAMFGAFLYIPLYLQSVYGSNAQEAGSLFTALMMSMVVGSIFAGQTVARTGKYKIFLVSGALITAIGMYLLGGNEPRRRPLGTGPQSLPLRTGLRLPPAHLHAGRPKRRSHASNGHRHRLHPILPRHRQHHRSRRLRQRPSAPLSRTLRRPHPRQHAPIGACCPSTTPCRFTTCATS